MALLNSYNIIKKKVKIADFEIINTSEQAEKIAEKFTYPCWLKISSPKLIHKTEHKAVLKCENLKQLKTNFKIIKKTAEKFKGKILIQKNFSGIELIFSIKNDKTFGKIIMLGLGGLFTEVHEQISFKSYPLNYDDITTMLGKTKILNLLTSRKKYPIEKLYIIIKKLSSLNKEIEINPLIINEKQIIAVDARAV